INTVRFVHRGADFVAGVRARLTADFGTSTPALTATSPTASSSKTVQVYNARVSGWAESMPRDLFAALSKVEWTEAARDGGRPYGLRPGPLYAAYKVVIDDLVDKVDRLLTQGVTHPFADQVPALAAAVRQV